MDITFQACDRLRNAYADDAVRKGLKADGYYANAMYQNALEVFIKLISDGHAKPFEEHVQWYINQIEEQADL